MKDTVKRFSGQELAHFIAKIVELVQEAGTTIYPYWPCEFGGTFSGQSDDLMDPANNPTLSIWYSFTPKAGYRVSTYEDTINSDLCVRTHQIIRDNRIILHIQYRDIKGASKFILYDPTTESIVPDVRAE